MSTREGNDAGAHWRAGRRFGLHCTAFSSEPSSLRASSMASPPPALGQSGIGRCDSGQPGLKRSSAALRSAAQQQRLSTETPSQAPAEQPPKPSRRWMRAPLPSQASRRSSRSRTCTRPSSISPSRTTAHSSASSRKVHASLHLCQAGSLTLAGQHRERRLRQPLRLVRRNHQAQGQPELESL